MQNRCYAIGCFLTNSSKADAHQLATLGILRNFISLQEFTVYMENSLRFEISLWSSEFHYAESHVNADNEVTSHRSKVLIFIIKSQKQEGILCTLNNSISYAVQINLMNNFLESFLLDFGENTYTNPKRYGTTFCYKTDYSP